MRILWISASIFDDSEEKQSGVWQKALALKLSAYPDIELINLSYQRVSSELIEINFGSIKQWGMPRCGKVKRGYPPKRVIYLFYDIIKKINPDIIHIWGSENPFKLLPFQDDLPGIKVLSMQGVLSSVAENLLNGLTLKQLISTIGIREIIKRETLFTIRKSFYDSASIERIMIKKCRYILTQSEWTESQVRPVNPDVHFFRVGRVLRTSFVEAKKWTEFEHNNPIIYSAAVGYTLKGLHVLIKAVNIVKSVYPNVELRLAGALGRTDFLGDGYLRLIQSMIKKYGLQNNVTWLGAIAASEIIKNLQEASVFVNPSFIESYSLVLAEAMTIGTPCVISYAGAMPELAENKKEALFFTPGDYKNCAYQIINLLSNPDIATDLSINAQKRAEYRNSITDTAAEQMRAYEAILLLEETKEGSQL